jgi:hypothetical protein
LGQRLLLKVSSNLGRREYIKTPFCSFSDDKLKFEQNFPQFPLINKLFV